MCVELLDRAEDPASQGYILCIAAGYRMKDEGAGEKSRGGGKKEVKGGEQENESKNTKVNLHLTLRQMILNLPKKGEKERSQQDLQRTFSYLLNWQLLLVLVRLLDTRL